MVIINHDRLFKELLTNFFQEFMEAFSPEAGRMLDYSSLEFLSQEILTDVTAGEKKYIDILVKTRLLGEEGFVLVHVEPQARKQVGFAKRMFRYYARLFLKYNLRILPVAVLSHNTKKEEPNSFEIAFPFLKVLEFEFMQLHLKRHSWKDYLQKDNPAVAALMACMDYREEEKTRLKLEFFKVIMRLRLDPARMQLLIGFFESYVVLTPKEEEVVQQRLAEELSMEDVREMAEILTSYHLRGREEGRAEGLTALQSTLIKQGCKKLGTISPEAEKKILETKSIPLLENALEKIFDLENEKALLELLDK
ncbi:MAG: Rpn family recombination-promoting nuclease/putative transposase [Bacillota bacterium]